MLWGTCCTSAHHQPRVDFVKLRKVVDKKKADLDVATVSVKVKNIPANMARVEIIKDR